MTFPCQTRLKRMRVMVICTRGVWALQSDSADATVKATDEQNQPQGARLVLDCILIYPDRPGAWQAVCSSELELVSSASLQWKLTKPGCSELGWVCFCWCAWLEIAHQQRFRATCALNTQQCNPISTAESQICPREFWGSEISKIHPGIMQCLISISNSSICNSRNLPLGKSGQYEDSTETNGDQRKSCLKLQSYPLGGLPSLKWNNYHLN